jgi:hypothetical protein
MFALLPKDAQLAAIKALVSATGPMFVAPEAYVQDQNAEFAEIQVVEQLFL